MVSKVGFNSLPSIKRVPQRTWDLYHFGSLFERASRLLAALRAAQNLISSDMVMRDAVETVLIRVWDFIIDWRRRGMTFCCWC